MNLLFLIRLVDCLKGFHNILGDVDFETFKENAVFGGRMIVTE